MSRMQRLGVVFGLNLGLVAALVAVGVTARSLAVFAEGGDLPQGGRDVTSAAALINAGWLLLLEVIVAVGAADRLLKAPRIRLACPDRQRDRRDRDGSRGIHTARR